MESSGVRTASHIGLWVLGIGIIVWLVYSATHTSSEQNRYAGGAESHDNHSTRWPFTIDLNFSCVPKEFIRADKSSVEVKNDKSITTNAVSVPVKH